MNPLGFETQQRVQVVGGIGLGFRFSVLEDHVDLPGDDTNRFACCARGAVTMYDVYIMRRTQIYLTEEQGRLLEERSRATGRTVSELIRAAIDDVHGGRRGMGRAERMRVARQTAGTWKDFPESGEKYVERLRGMGRMARLHGRT
jgi:Ribbon-helix-helix protein, copG family